METTISVEKEVARLLRLTPDNVKKNLSTCSHDVVMSYLSDLFKGNGYITAIHTGNRNAKVLLLSEPRQPDNVILMVKFISDPGEITYDEAREELRDFENNLEPLYGCKQFCILSLNGFQTKAEHLEDHNLLLQDWDYLEDMIAHYSKDNVREPRIQLFAHNKQTYKKVRKMMERTNTIAVEQATGTGKSYLIARLLQDFAGERKLVMAPSYYVIDQIREHIRWESENIEFMTYPGAMNLTPAEIAELKPKMIVLDEFHRCGAEEWGRGVQNILEAYPKAFKFGTSATPIRYLDNGRDMSKELFDGHVAEKLNLAQAIVRNILPMPKYVCALYTLGEELEILKSKIHRSKKRPHDKQKLLLELDTAHIDWERSRGIPHVLQKHMKKNMRKFIVFCSDEAHLHEMEPVVKKWFKEAMDDIPIKTYRIYTNESKSDEQLDDFKTDTSKDHLHLLFSINMLNEGLHVNEVNGVILLRPTESPNIFYQQIGRCLKVGLNHQPVIFDFVNNFRSIHTNDFLYDLGAARMSWLEERFEDDLEDRCPKFTVHDEVREVTDVFGDIEFRVDNWEEMFDRLVEFKKRFGHCMVFYNWPEDPGLGVWLKGQRERQRYGKLSEERFRRLDKLGVVFDLQAVRDSKWEEMFDLTVEYKKRFGNCDIPHNWKENPTLGHWLANQRKNHRSGKLEEERFRELNKLGVNWEIREVSRFSWDEMFARLLAHKKKHGNVKIPYDGGHRNSLFDWFAIQRHNNYHNKLNPERKQRFIEEGIELIYTPGVPPDERWQAFYTQLVKFKKEHGNLKVPKNNPALRHWMVSQRKNYRVGKLSKERTEKLNLIGLDFYHFDEKWEKKYQELLDYKKKYGHTNANRKLHYSIHEWSVKQRRDYHSGKMDESRLNKLKAIGFSFSPMEEAWEKNYNALVKYKKQHGDCNVPTTEAKYKSLFNWISKERARYKRGKMEEDKIKLLNKLDIDWEPTKNYWDKMYNELEDYYKKHGNSHVPSLSKEYPSLGKWCVTLRKNYREKRLTSEQQKKLEKLKFPWVIPQKGV